MKRTTDLGEYCLSRYIYNTIITVKVQETLRKRKKKASKSQKIRKSAVRFSSRNDWEAIPLVP